MQKVILIHGYAGKDLSLWLQWVEKQLNNKYEVFFPAYEMSTTPNMEEWTAMFDGILKKDSEEDYIFIAHSIGCLVTMKLIEKYNTKVKNMILVACPQNRIEAHGQLLKKITDEEKRIFTKFVEHSYDWDLIQSKVKQTNFFFSDDDFAIPYDETLCYYKELFPNAEFKTFHNYGHFNRKNNIFELPEVLYILK